MNYLVWLWTNYKTWKRYKNLPKVFQRADGMFPSETYFKYPPNTTFNGKAVLNVGCGKTVFRAPNVVNLDCVGGDGTNVVWDLSKTPIPSPDATFDHILANHVLEHVPNWFECFKELARMLKPGGLLEVWVPPDSADTSRTFRDHINSIGLRSFDGCGPSASGGANALADYEFQQFKDLKKLKLVGYFQRPIIKWWTLIVPQSVLAWMCQHLRNIVSEENFMFRKLP